MNIVYKDTKQIAAKDLEHLFQSVNWMSANYPHRLERAMQGASTVFTAWDGSRLIGLINVLDDREMTAYIHYLLVDPAYHSLGVGTRLLDSIKKEYKNYLYIVVLSEKKETVPFYEKNGFTKGTCTPLMILNK